MPPLKFLNGFVRLPARMFLKLIFSAYKINTGVLNFVRKFGEGLDNSSIEYSEKV